MHAPMHIGMVVALIASHCVDDRRRLLSGCGAVEVDEVMTVYLLVQGREVGAARCYRRLTVLALLSLRHASSPSVNADSRSSTISVR
jgi:hypothetical protein